jgi:hypothetical protein
MTGQSGKNESFHSLRFKRVAMDFYFISGIYLLSII